MKRILSIIIALACCLVLPVSALAADEVIEPGHILPQNSTLNRYTRMDAENYYVQAGDMHEIDGLLKEIRDRRGDSERRY